MSDPMSPLNSAIFEGAVKISEAPMTSMISVRGDLASGKLGRAIKAVTGASVPDPRRISVGETGKVVWMSPDELLLMTSYTQTDFDIATLDTQMKGEFFMATNVSDARAHLVLTGAGAREVLAKGAPIDLSADAFGAGDVRRTRLGQLPAAIWSEEGEIFDLVCFRSVAGFVFEWLSTASRAGSLPQYLD